MLFRAEARVNKINMKFLEQAEWTDNDNISGKMLVVGCHQVTENLENLSYWNYGI